MELPSYANAAFAGVPLLFLVSGLTLFWGKLGLSGKRQLAAALLTGLVVGILYMVTTVRPPSGDWYTVFAYWAANVVYGLGLGLVAVGAYETTKKAAAKGQVAAIQKLESESYMGAAAPKQE